MTLQVGKKMTNQQVRALPDENQPVQFEPFGLTHPAPGRGVGLKRLSPSNDRWCPFCQTVLGTRQRSCARCQPQRDALVDGRRVPPSDSAPASAEPEIDHAVRGLVDAIDEMARVVAMASAYGNRRTLTKRQVEDMFAACKEVMVQADPLRRKLRDANSQ